MNVEEFRDFCLNLPAAEECFPFDEETLVFKVLGKIFALTDLEQYPFCVNLKCDPDYAMELREKHPEILAGWHMNKKYWNTVDFEGNLPNKFLKELTQHSYDEVVKKLTRKQKTELENYK